MSTIVLNAESAAALRKCSQPAVLQDAEGKIIGYFEPPAPIYAPGELPEFDEDELNHRVQRWQGIPSAEVRRRLEELR